MEQSIATQYGWPAGQSIGRFKEKLGWSVWCPIQCNDDVKWPANCREQSQAVIEVMIVPRDDKARPLSWNIFQARWDRLQSAGGQAARDQAHGFIDQKLSHVGQGAGLANWLEHAALAAQVGAAAPTMTAAQGKLEDTQDCRQVAERREPIGPGLSRIGAGDTE
jgi:hypothetical protein